MKRVLTCVYCGHEYPQETPAWGDKILTEHIKKCPKHPLRIAELKIKLLQNALIGLIGVDSIPELKEMEAIVLSHPSSDLNKPAVLNAISALLFTIPE